MICTLAEVKQYLNIPTGTTTDDALLNTLITASQQRIEDYTKRKFEAVTDTTRYFDAIMDVDGRTLELDADLSYITAIVNNGATLPASEYVTDPRNVTPYEAIKIKSSSVYYWDYTTDPEDAISVTGRWAVMLKIPFTGIARATNTVTATFADTSGLAVGNNVQVVGVADTAFNGSFTLATVTATTATWSQTAANDTDTSGYILIPPPSIRHACIRLVAYLYRQKDTQGGDADRPILAGDGSVIMPTTLPRDVQMLLAEWVKIR